MCTKVKARLYESLLLYCTETWSLQMTSQITQKNYAHLFWKDMISNDTLQRNERTHSATKVREH